MACAAQFGFTHYLYGVQCFAFGVFLLVYLSVAEHLRHHVCGKRVYARHAHAVESAGNLVGAFVEFSACVQHGHYYFERRFVFFLVFVYWYSAAVVLYGNGVVCADCYFDVRAESRERLVDGVVYCFVNQVVQSLFAYVAYIHGRAFAYRLEPFEYLDVTCGIVFCTVSYVVHWF